MEFHYYVYIMSNRTHTTIYIGMTNNLLRRVDEHRNKLFPESFTAKYGIDRLVYFEATNDVNAAIQREKQLKSWSRKRKNALIESMNPEWDDLYEQIRVG